MGQNKVNRIQKQEKQALEEAKGELEEAIDTEKKDEAAKEGEEKLEEAAE